MPITSDEVRKVLEHDEDTRAEYKEMLSEEVAQKLSRSFAAMANSEGGMIIFGVTKDRRVVGCEIDEKGRNRISQEASNCRPPIKIELDDIALDGRKLCVVTIPKSTVVHNDVERRFPIRIGNITDYLDAGGMMALMRERGLLTKEQTQKFYEAPVVKRTLIPASQSTGLKALLDSGDQALRNEGLQDLKSMPYKYILLEDSGIAASMERLLSSGTGTDHYLTLDALNSIVFHASEAEEFVIEKWVGLIVDIAKSCADARAAQRAFELLRYMKRAELVSVLTQWIAQVDDERYEQLQPKGMVTSGMSELKGSVREAMYGILEKKPGEIVKKRASAILDALRRSGD